MDDYNKQNSTPDGNNSEQQGATFNQSGEYRYVPPKKPAEQQTPPTQNYYYRPTGASEYQNKVNQSANQSTDYARQSHQYYVPNQGAGVNYVNGKPVKQKKPMKTSVKIIIAIVAICAVFAIGTIILSAAGVITNHESESNDITSSQGDASASISDSSETDMKDKNGNLTVAGVASENMDSCVLVSVYTEQSAYNYFYGHGNNSSSSDPTLSGEGSGVIMSESDGYTYIMTCAHVISGGSTFKVTTNDDKEYEATMVGVDSQTDIGVLKIKATGLKVAEFANSEKISVGEQCVAIGCPGGSKFMNSVATGIVSALDRPVSSSIGYNNECIQTDTAINPGNSGGALFNMQGQVIGINSSKIASTEYEGMGFAIPSNTAVNTANSLIKNGYVAGRAKLGLTYVPISKVTNAQSVISALAEKGYKGAEGAMVINEISSDSDLANKDVKKYDVIVAVNGDVLTSTDVMTSVLSKSSPGDTVKLTIARIENNSIKTFEVDCKLIESKE